MIPRGSDAPHQRRNIAPDVVQTLWQLTAWHLGDFPAVSGAAPVLPQ